MELAHGGWLPVNPSYCGNGRVSCQRETVDADSELFGSVIIPKNGLGTCSFQKDDWPLAYASATACGARFSSSAPPQKRCVPFSPMYAISMSVFAGSWCWRLKLQVCS